jgi:hypothetical protein
VSERQTELETGSEETPPESEETPPESGGDELERLKAEAVKSRRQARAAEKVADELRTELERRRVESESEQEKAIREAVEAERARLTEEFSSERLHNRLRIRSAGKLEDPEDAVMHLGSELEADASDEEIDKALDTLLEQKGYLAISSSNGPEGGRGRVVTQGVRSGTPDRTEQSPDAWLRGRASRR